jgi:hypothetical protein
MTIDERLDRLTERHEALTQSVELMVLNQRETHEKNQVLMIQIMESINDLARIAHGHEQRISDIEKRRN